MNLFEKLKHKVRVHNLKDKQTLISIVLNISLILFIFYPLYANPPKANATVTESFVRFDRLSNGAAITGTACEKTSTVGTETGVVIVFPTSWTISQTAGNWTTTTTGLPVDPADNTTGATAWPGIGTATQVNGFSVRFPSTDLTTATFYCFNFAGASSTMASGNDEAGALKTQGGAPYVDSTNWAVSVVTANADQITVTASVSATMSFALSGNAIALGTLNTSSAVSGAITMTVSTNARNGFLSWVQGTNTTGGSGLRSVTAASTIPSTGSFDGTPSDLASTTGVVLDADAGTNTPNINAEYNGSNSTSGGFFEGAVFHQMAYLTGVQSGTTVVINARSKVASTQPAASDYSDTLTVVAAGSF